MVQLTKYIVQLLHQHDCVIIPDFGGFVAQYKPATLDRVTGFSSPPSKQILFTMMSTLNPQIQMKVKFTNFFL